MRRISRRSTLQAAAAIAGLGLPLLDALSPVRADTRTHPKRFIFLFNPNGTIQRSRTSEHEEFWPSVGKEPSDFTLPEITEPLGAFAERLLFLKGLNLASADPALGPGGPHQRGMGALLTGRELQQGDFIGGDTSRAGWANGASLDQVMAARHGGATLLPSLELGVRATESEVRSRLSYAGPANPLPPINSPADAYQRIFSGFTSVTADLRQRRQDVADTLHQLYGELTPTLSQQDKEKVEGHLELLRGIERRLGVTVDPSRCASPDRPPELEPDDEDHMEELSRLQIQLLAAAVSCDITRVATLQFSSAINALRMPWLPSLGNGHNLSHAGEKDRAARLELVKRSRWYAERMAELLSALDAIPEGEGSALDNTAVLWGNELGVGNTHSLESVPFVLAGSCAGTFRTGRALDFGGTPHNGLLVSLLNAMDVDVDRFGHPDIEQGALSDLT